MRGSIDMIQLVFRGLLVLTFLEISFARTCDERLQNLENLFQNLQLRLEDRDFPNYGFGNSEQDALNMKLERQNQDLERRVVILEEALTDSNRQMHHLKVRVSELERKSQKQEIRLSSLEGHDFVSKIKVPNVDSKAQKQSKQTDIPNDLKDTLPTIFESRPSIGDNFTQTKGDPMTIQSKRNVPVDVLNVTQEKRLLSGLQKRQNPLSGGVAFSAYISTYETDISKDHTIKFDRIVTNIGNHYNPYTGIFTAPQHGVYVFTWNLYCKTEGFIFSQIVVNVNAVGALFVSTEGAISARTTTGIVVVEVNQGDVVFVRTHPTEIHHGNLFSSPNWRSSFNGWKLF